MTSPGHEAAFDREALLAQAEEQYGSALAAGYLEKVAGTVPVLRRAVAVTPLDHPAGMWCRLSLAHALTMHFEAAAEPKALDEAIALLSEVARALPRGDTDRKAALVNLSSALSERSGYLAEPADLIQAIEAIREALATEPYDAVLLASLANLLVDRYRSSGSPTDLDEAIATGERAVKFAPPQATHRPAALANLAKARLDRYRLRSDPHDLDAAIILLQQALELLPPDAAGRFTALNMLAAAWRDRFKARGDRADIDRAIKACRLLARVGSQRPHLAAGFLTGLGICLRIRADAFDREEDLAEAIDAWRAAAALPGPTSMRFIATTLAATNQSERGRVAEAVEDYATAVGLLPLLAWRGLDRASREKLLGNYPAVAEHAAASAVAAGDAGRAVELLEQGRSVLWGQLLETRGDLTALHEAHPELATRLDRLRDALDLGAGTLNGPPPH